MLLRYVWELELPIWADRRGTPVLYFVCRMRHHCLTIVQLLLPRHHYAICGTQGATRATGSVSRACSYRYRYRGLVAGKKALVSHGYRPGPLGLLHFITLSMLSSSVMRMSRQNTRSECLFEVRRKWYVSSRILVHDFPDADIFKSFRGRQGFLGEGSRIRGGILAAWNIKPRTTPTMM